MRTTMALRPAPPITRERTTSAPPAAVQDLLVDVGSWPLWSPHVVRTDPASGRVHPGWRGRVKPWFGPATTMEVTEVLPGGGMRWRTRALGHELRYAQLVSAAPGGGSRVVFTAEVHGPVGPLVQRLAAPLSGFGQQRRLERLVLLAERTAA
ncbi:SRPBCC family protein [Quadrisphaera sp. KR29]|uniref:SRPBCC family protein n=1 Tax=Quadrisphaera sp. KR29 TaxID=3461391 RepID=UPI004043B2C6